MVKPNYETMLEEPAEINLGFYKPICSPVGIVITTLRKMKSEQFQDFINKAGKLETFYRNLFAKLPDISAEPEKPFAELEPEKQQQILFAAMIMHGIAFTQLQKETVKAKQAARWTTSKTMEGFINDD